ncbi:MAG: ABC transporter permease subunit [Candidatus Azambacteria bacterium]|nr:ABC transporter permease subunit [Candidatus Azambacteria bacterium]
MQTLFNLFGTSVDTKLPKRFSVILSLLLFFAIIAGYLMVSQLRHIDNPDDKIVPSAIQLLHGIQVSVSPDRNGEIPILIDTIASLQRFFLGVAIASLFAILFGISMGVFPIIEAFFLRFMLYLGKIPPLALLPMIFIFSGLGESTKVILIIVGITPAIMLDTYFGVKKIPQEQLVKVLTLGASRMEVLFCVVLPQILPSALTAVRLNLLPAWLFLIAGEAIAANAGLGYRIFLVRRYLAMDTIIPYVFWIASLAFLVDFLLSWWVKHKYSWYGK